MASRQVSRSCCAARRSWVLRAAGLLEWGRLLTAETADVDPRTSRAARATLASGSMRRAPSCAAPLGENSKRCGLIPCRHFLPTKGLSCSLREDSRSFALLVLSGTLWHLVPPHAYSNRVLFLQQVPRKGHGSLLTERFFVVRFSPLQHFGTSRGLQSRWSRHARSGSPGQTLCDRWCQTEGA
jgi:hypothetical protein